MSVWQPIETAPKDGTIVDLWVVSACPEADHQMVDFHSPTACKVSGQALRHGRVTACQWRTKRPNSPAWYPAGSLCGYPLSPEVKATHWMSLPKPPGGAA